MFVCLSVGWVCPLPQKFFVEKEFAVSEIVKCGRCQKEIDKEKSEICWYCTGWLCCKCWDKYGHCGHPEADAANERARRVKQPRRQVVGKYDEQVISFVDDFWKRNYRSPSIREVMAAAGISSSSVAHYVVRKLAKRGGYTITNNSYRAIVPPWVKTAIEQARDPDRFVPEHVADV